MAPVETKVAWSSAGAYIGSAAGLAALQALADTNLVAALPDMVEPFIWALIPVAVTFLAGYRAQHTPRPDLDPAAAPGVGDHAAGPDRPPFDPDLYDDDPNV